MTTITRPRRECQHCHGVKTIQGHGLCLTCWRNPEIRQRYPVTRPCENLDAIPDRVSWRSCPLPEEPCPHPPGSLQKVLVLVERAARGEHLWHPDDAGWDLWQGECPERLRNWESADHAKSGKKRTVAAC
jgi:hypothetical protein